MEKLEEWEKKNLKIFWLPTYSPPEVLNVEKSRTKFDIIDKKTK
jgi:hypothetical protein